MSTKKYDKTDMTKLKKSSLTTLPKQRNSRKAKYRMGSGNKPLKDKKLSLIVKHCSFSNLVLWVIGYLMSFVIKFIPHGRYPPL
jgi:hypothetical protein